MTSRGLAAVMVAAAAALGACAPSYQSARVVEPGKVQVTAALLHTEGGPTDQYGGWQNLADLQVRGGVVDRVDLGFRLVREPGTSYRSYAALDAKVELVPDELSLALPLGVVWYQEGDRFDREAVLVAPALIGGIDLRPDLELVGSTRLVVVLPGPRNDGFETEFGGTVGLRFTNADRSWALHPELGILRTNAYSEAHTFVTVGLGVSVGN